MHSHLADYRSTVTVDGVSIEISIKGIDQHSTMDAFTAHDPLFKLWISCL